MGDWQVNPVEPGKQKTADTQPQAAAAAQEGETVASQSAGTGDCCSSDSVNGCSTGTGDNCVSGVRVSRTADWKPGAGADQTTDGEPGGQTAESPAHKQMLFSCISSRF